MPAITRELNIVYGTTTVGGTTEVLLHGDPPFSITRDYETTTVEFDVIVQDDVEADFSTACNDLETAFTTPNQDLAITLGSTKIHEWDHSTGSGFNHRPRISKPGSPFDTGRSRLYHIEVEFDTPAFLSGKNGLRRGREILSLSPAGVKTLRLVGTYTAQSGGLAARGQFDAQIAGYASAVQTAVGGGTWELIGGEQDVDDTDRVINFDYVYQELKQNQSSGTLDDTDIKGASMRIRRVRVAPGDSDPTTVRLITLAVDYTAWIDVSQSTDLTGKWSSKILPHIKAQAASVSGASQIALINSEPVFDYQRNQITAALQFQAVAGGRLVQSRTTETLHANLGKQLVAVWNGDLFARDLFQGPRTTFRTVVNQVVEVGETPRPSAGGLSLDIGGSGGAFGVFGQGKISKGVQGAFGLFGANNKLALQFEGPAPSSGGGSAGAKADKDGFVVLRTISRVTPLTVGLSPYRFQLHSRTDIEVAMRANILETGQFGGAGGGGGRGPITQPGGDGGRVGGDTERNRR